MVKKSRQQKKNPPSSSHNLKTLVEDLEAVEPRPSWPYGTLVALVMVMLALVWGWYLLAANHKENLRAPYQVDYAQVRPFDWTEEEFIALELGTTEAAVIAAHGAAHKGEDYPSKQSFQRQYEVQDPVTFELQEVSLTFSTADGQAKLVSKYFSGLELPHVRPLGDDVHARAFSKGDVKKLRVGDSETGEGGVSLKEVLTTYGQPTWASYALREEVSSIDSKKSGLKRLLSLHYWQPEAAPYDWVTLRFQGMGDGEFYLSSKDAD